jgi:hypothetical protein
MSRRPQPAAAHHLGPAPTDQPSQTLAHPLLRTKNSADVVNRHALRFPLPRGYEEAAGVLKITRVSDKGRGLTIKLEGEVFGPWVDSFRAACAIRGRRPRRLDLAAVTYVDAAGVELLRDLIAEGVEIAACSSFVHELLQLKS